MIKDELKKIKIFVLNDKKKKNIINSFMLAIFIPYCKQICHNIKNICPLNSKNITKEIKTHQK